MCIRVELAIEGWKELASVFNMDLRGINTVNSAKKEKKARRSAQKDL